MFSQNSFLLHFYQIIAAFISLRDLFQKHKKSNSILFVQYGMYVCMYVYKYTVMAKYIGTLGKYDKRRLWKCICIDNPFDLLSKNSLENKNLKWDKI